MESSVYIVLEDCTYSQHVFMEVQTRGLSIWYAAKNSYKIYSVLLASASTFCNHDSISFRIIEQYPRTCLFVVSHRNYLNKNVTREGRGDYDNVFAICEKEFLHLRPFVYFTIVHRFFSYGFEHNQTNQQYEVIVIIHDRIASDQQLNDMKTLFASFFISMMKPYAMLLVLDSTLDDLLQKLFRTIFE